MGQRQLVHNKKKAVSQLIGGLFSGGFVSGF
jgi:hypothetical protein